MTALRRTFQLTGNLGLPQCAVIVAGLGVIDYLTGFELSFAIFYVLPVLICAWNRGFLKAAALAVCAAAVWQLSNLAAGQRYEYALIPIWNAFTRLGFFLLLSYLLSALKGRLQAEEAGARRDPLTGLLNRRALYEILTAEISRAQRFRHPLHVALIDVDNFKQLNDSEGHPVGDAALAAVADTLRQNIRASDVAARLGGDEFAVIYVEESTANTYHSAQRLKAALDELARRKGWASSS